MLLGYLGHRLTYARRRLRNRHAKAQVGCLSSPDTGHQVNGDGSAALHDVTGGAATYASRSRAKRDNCYKYSELLNEGSDQLNDRSDGGQSKQREKATGQVMSFQNSTLQSAETGSGESYWVSFEEKSFSKGEDFKVYRGRMNGKGPKSGDRCVVKVFRRSEGTENLCRCEVNKSQKAKSLAKAFNNHMSNRQVRIKFTTLYWAQMDEVSKIKQLFFTGERKLTTTETVLFEEDLRINHDRPTKHKEVTLFVDCQGRNSFCLAKDLEAFAHYTYHVTQGELILCGLDGIHDEDGFYLKTPTIHSRNQNYGSSDRGLHGILDVFSHHVCNSLCKDMMKPKEDFNHQVFCEKTQKLIPGQYTSENLSQQTKALGIIYPSRPQFIRQNSVDQKESVSGCSWLHRERPSFDSQPTENSSGYLEPSAPLEDFGEVRFECSPPPYSSLNVANWLLNEHTQNNFINMTPLEPTRPVKSDCLPNQSSIESGIGTSIVTMSEVSSLQGTSTDLNANFSEVETSGVSTIGCWDELEDGERTINDSCERKRVRFSLSCDSDGLSDAPTIITGSCSLTSAHTLSRFQSAPTFQKGQKEDCPCATLALLTHDHRCHLRAGGGPPSYTDSETQRALSSGQQKFAPCLKEPLNKKIDHTHIAPDKTIHTAHLLGPHLVKSP